MKDYNCTNHYCTMEKENKSTRDSSLIHHTRTPTVCIKYSFLLYFNLFVMKANILLAFPIIYHTFMIPLYNNGFIITPTPFLFTFSVSHCSLFALSLQLTFPLHFQKSSANFHVVLNCLFNYNKRIYCVYLGPSTGP